jgi:hypothetical protein
VVIDVGGAPQGGGAGITRRGRPCRSAIGRTSPLRPQASGVCC